MVAYDADGIRRWSLTTDEVITAQPVRATDAEMVAVTLGGEVLRIDAASGKVHWRAQPGSDVGLPPASATAVAVIADRGGSIHGLDLSDGRVKWENDVQEPAAIDAHEGRVGVASFGYVTCFDAGSGEPIWRASYPGTATDLVLTKENAVLTGSDGLRAFHLDGRLAYTRQRGVDVSTDGHWLVLWGPQRAEVQGATGTVESFATPVESAGSPHRHLVGARGVYLFDSTWDFRGWTDG
jgi:outer membrane protein assembly factor BamB